ncbi:Uncharacterised protein [Pantoea agglomerans]|uniref:Uncharacterized protein n=1 Tax=Enterobacter agglomerans TaxID=549 RepID=A0A379AK53_ENTAG|nr:Uncharacterised protein [Pantoea agglomerans]
MQKAVNRAATLNGERQRFQLARQALSRLFIGAVRQRLRLVGQFIPFYIGIGRNAVEMRRV